jgi:hypothetical protein
MTSILLILAHIHRQAQEQITVAYFTQVPDLIWVRVPDLLWPWGAANADALRERAVIAATATTIRLRVFIVVPPWNVLCIPCSTMRASILITL